MSSALRVLDPALALERAGGNQDLARELYQMLQDELPTYTSDLQKHFDSGDFTSLLELTHKLNGSSTYCGVPALKEAASSLESYLKKGTQEMYAGALADVLCEIKRLQQTPKLSI